MDVFQMHLEVRQRLQKVGIQKEESFFKEEIDLSLNRAQIRLIKKIFDKRFENRELFTKFLNPLLIKNKEKQVYTFSGSESHSEDNAVYAVYPPDLLLLVNDRSIITHNTCGPIDNRAYEDIIEYQSNIAFPTSNLSTGPYYSEVRVLIGGSEVYSKAEDITGVNNKSYTFPLIEDILYQVNRSASNRQLYWETYRGEYFPNSFILVSTDPTFNNVEFKIEIYQSDKVTIDTFTSRNTVGVTYKTYSSSLIIPNSITKTVPNRLTDISKVYDYLNNPFYKAKPEEPLSTDAGGLLYIYEGKSFIVAKCKLDYIRKPRQISLSLKQSCEAGEILHDQIVDWAVEMLKLDIESKSYGASVQESEIRHQK